MLMDTDLLSIMQDVTFTTGGKLERPQPRFVYSWI